MDHRNNQSSRDRLTLEAGTSNRVLEAWEQHIVRELLCDAEEQLKLLDLQIATNHSAYGTRARLFHNIAAFNIAIAPHKLLPPEILSHIFLLCLRNKPVVFPPIFNKSPWNLSRVCSKWRLIALDEPQLWTSIDIRGGHPHIANTTPSLHEFLLRTRKKELSLTFKCPTNPNEIIMPYSHRIKTLQIIDTEPLFLTSNGPFDSLESATLQFASQTNELWYTALTSDITVFGKAPKLTSIAFRFNSTYSIAFSSMAQISLPWSQLTSLTFFHISPPFLSVLEIIRESVSLIDFNFTLKDGPFIAYIDFPELNDFPLILHHNLRSLHLGLGEENHLGSFLRPLTLPSLKKFQNTGFYSPLSYEEIWVHPHFLTFINQSSSSLESFSLAGEALMPRMREVFHAMPSLVNLKLTHGYAVSTQIFDLMRDGELLPVLETLICETLSVCASLAFLESRINCAHYGGMQEAKIRAHRIRLIPGDLDLSEELFKKLRPSLVKERRNVVIEIQDDLVSYPLGQDELSVAIRYSYMGILLKDQKEEDGMLER